MKVPPRDRVYLQHMLEAIERIERYLQNVTQEEFEQNELLQDGVIRQLMVLGEAARRVSEETRQRHPEIPWREIVGMRHKLVHEYFGIDLELVWMTVQIDLPALKRAFLALLQELASD